MALIRTIGKLYFLICVASALNNDKSSPIGEEKSTVVYRFAKTGLGSNLVNMLMHINYYNEKGLSFKVDESEIRYRYKGKGALKSFFTPRFEVIESLTRLHELERDPAVFIDEKHSNRIHIKKDYGFMGLLLYRWLSKPACVHLNINPAAQRDIKELMIRSNMDGYEDGITVGFHVRRGDKIGKESRKFEAEDYVEKLKLLSIREKIDSCFIASDDYSVLGEMQEALVDAHIFCEIKSLMQPKQHGNQQRDQVSDDDVLQFITELNILIKSTYFIGTFNSNVGAIVSLMRSCIHKDEKKEHYARSYAVDNHYFLIK